jgi:hypothetical protein
MNSQTLNLTKAQVAGIISYELKKNNIWLQCFLLSIIGLIVINLLPGAFTQILTLLINVAQLVVLYFMYNSIKNRIDEFKEKYPGEN